MTRSRATTAVFSFALALAAGRSAQAQLVNGQWRAAPQSSGVPASSRGVARSPHENVRIVYPGNSPTIFAPSVFPRRPIAFTFIPAVIMSDGSVFADFGFGYEPVSRSCSGNVVLRRPLRPRRVAVSGGVSFDTPTYTQPVPNQQTSSQLMVQATTSGRRASDAARRSCFTRDGAGHLVAVR